MTEEKLLQVRIKLEAEITQRCKIVAFDTAQRERTGSGAEFAAADLEGCRDRIESLLKEFEQEPMSSKKKVVVVQGRGHLYPWTIEEAGREPFLDCFQTRQEAIAECQRNGWEVVE